MPSPRTDVLTLVPSTSQPDVASCPRTFRPSETLAEISMPTALSSYLTIPDYSVCSHAEGDSLHRTGPVNHGMHASTSDSSDSTSSIRYDVIPSSLSDTETQSVSERADTGNTSTPSAGVEKLAHLSGRLSSSGGSIRLSVPILMLQSLEGRAMEGLLPPNINTIGTSALLASNADGTDVTKKPKDFDTISERTCVFHVEDTEEAEGDSTQGLSESVQRFLREQEEELAAYSASLVVSESQLREHNERTHYVQRQSKPSRASRHAVPSDAVGVAHSFDKSRDRDRTPGGTPQVSPVPRGSKRSSRTVSPCLSLADKSRRGGHTSRSITPAESSPLSLEQSSPPRSGAVSPVSQVNSEADTAEDERRPTYRVRDRRELSPHRSNRSANNGLSPRSFDQPGGGRSAQGHTSRGLTGTSGYVPYNGGVGTSVAGQHWNENTAGQRDFWDSPRGSSMEEQQPWGLAPSRTVGHAGEWGIPHSNSAGNNGDWGVSRSTSSGNVGGENNWGGSISHSHSSGNNGEWGMPLHRNARINDLSMQGPSQGQGQGYKNRNSKSVTPDRPLRIHTQFNESKRHEHHGNHINHMYSSNNNQNQNQNQNHGDYMYESHQHEQSQGSTINEFRHHGTSGPGQGPGSGPGQGQGPLPTSTHKSSKRTDLYRDRENTRARAVPFNKLSKILTKNIRSFNNVCTTIFKFLIFIILPTFFKINMHLFFYYLTHRPS